MESDRTTGAAPSRGAEREQAASQTKVERPKVQPARPKAPGRRDAVVQAKSRYAQAQAGQGLPSGIGAEPAVASARELLDASAAMGTAAMGTAQASAPLPHGDVIQAAFGRHDVSGALVQVGGAAVEATDQLNAEAYAYGDRIAFREQPDLHTAAHEAAHYVQQQQGVQLKGGMSRIGDPFERHADAVADAVVRGESAEPLLDAMPASSGGGPGRAIQRIENQRPEDRTTETRHVVARGDTLSRLARRFLGDPRRWREIRERNRDQVYGNDMIIVGRVLIIPAATTAEGTGGGQSGSGQSDGGQTDGGQTDGGQTGSGQTDGGQTSGSGQSDSGQTGGSGTTGGGGAGETEARTPVEMLADSVNAQDGLSAYQTWTTLSADERLEVRTDSDFFGNFLGVTSRANALTVVTDVESETAARLEVAALRTPVEAEFLTAAMNAVGINSPETLAPQADTLGRLHVYGTVAVLDPIVNGTGVTAAQQIDLLVAPSAGELLDAAWNNASPLTYMTALMADPTTAREAMISFDEIRRRFLTDPVALEAVILTDTDPFAWFTALVQLGELDFTGQMIAQNQMLWGEILLPSLPTLVETQTTAINEHANLQGQIIAACILFGSDTVALDVALALRLDLPGTIKAFYAAAVLSETMSESLIISATAAEQKALANDNEAMIIVVGLHPEYDPVALLGALASTPTDFTAATIASEAFAGWVAREETQLRTTIALVPDGPGWIASFKHYGNWELLLSVAADPGIVAQLRAGIVATTGAYNWLVTSCTKPLTDDAQAATLLELYGDGSGIDVADKYTTWACLYRARLGRVGSDIVRTWGTFTTNTKTWVAVDPDSTAMDLFFHQMKQIPRTHIDTASLVIMCPYFVHEVDPFIGDKYFVNKEGATIAAPGRVPMGTSYYFGSENAIVMRSMNQPGATGTATPDGTADTRTIGAPYADGTPSAVNTRGTSPLSGSPHNLTMFQNHVTHEFGHSVGARTLNKGSYNITPNNWTKNYADWTTSGDAEDYARMLGFTETMDDTEYTLTVGTNTLDMDGDDIREFLTNQAQGTNVDDDDPADHFGSLAAGMTAIKSVPTLASNRLVRTVDTLRGSMPNRTFRFPHGIDPSATRVTFFSTRWTNDWVSYHRDAFDNKVSWYSLSSYKEMFAEIYTAKYTGGALPPAIGSNDPAAFFNELENATPAELGMDGDSSGAGAQSTSDGDASQAGAGTDSQGQSGQDDTRDPNEGDIRPWP